MKTSEILDKAADVIERNGFAKDCAYVNRTINRTGYQLPDRYLPCDVLGALFLAELGEVRPEEGLPIAEVFADHLGVPKARHLDRRALLSEWSDAEERTEEEVLAALRSAAASEREAGR